MGYSYCENYLCCDGCGGYGPGKAVSRRRCPYGYCPAPALCQNCNKKENWTSKENHKKNGCEIEHARYIVLKAKEKELLEAGRFLRCAALSHNSHVKVIFRGKDSEKACLMSHETYHAFPLLEPVTIEDFQKVGALIETDNTDLYQAE